MKTSTPESQPRFLADVMLGTLARWLRILGYDTCYDNQIDDDQFVRRCLDEGRIALTRDVRLAKRRLIRDRAILIASQNLKKQVREVLEAAGLEIDTKRLLTRCVECNERIRKIEKASVYGEVPVYIFSTQESFKRCDACGRIYWRGTHRERILRRLLEFA